MIAQMVGEMVGVLASEDKNHRGLIWNWFNIACSRVHVVMTSLKQPPLGKILTPGGSERDLIDDYVIAISGRLSGYTCDIPRNSPYSRRCRVLTDLVE
jgi:hypothetical protein